MIDKRVFKEIQGDKSKQSVYSRISTKRKQYDNLISQKEAAYILAAEEGIDLFKYLESAEVEKIRSLMKQNVRPVTNPPQKVQRQQSHITKSPKEKRTKSTKLTVEFDSLQIQNLPTQLVNEAKEMANIYPLFYILENSIRIFIGDILSKSVGNNWWESAKISKKIKQNVETRMRDDERAKWHGRRKEHPIFYVNTGDLSRIIEGNWDHFKNIGLTTPQWVNTYITEIIERSRNIVMHCNPLSKQDIRRIHSVFEDWMRIVNPEDIETKIKSDDVRKETGSEIKSTAPSSSIIDEIKKQKEDRIRSLLVGLAECDLISSTTGQLKIDAIIKDFQARILISLLLRYPEARKYSEIYNDILYPTYSTGSVSPKVIVSTALKSLRKRKVIGSSEGANIIPDSKIDEAIDYVEYIIKNQ